jgi:short-subunit dehydrogenase
LDQGSGSVDIGTQILQRAVDLFAEGDQTDLKVHILIHSAALVSNRNLEAETIESFNSIFNVNGSFFLDTVTSLPI